MNSCDGTRRDSTTNALRFQLVAGRVGVEADVRLRKSGDRWISIAGSCGRQVTGIGPTARAAVVCSLDWLGAGTVSELLADLRLLNVSLQLRELSAG
jgi:hypothetical protein